MYQTQLSTITTKIGRFAMRNRRPILALALLNAFVSGAQAQQNHQHTSPAKQQQVTADQEGDAETLIKIVRNATERFQDVKAAEAEGYALQFGCVTGSDSGAMGLHYVNGAIVNSGILDATRPQIVIYEPTPGGGLKLIGADYLIIAEGWDKTHNGAPPELMGQLFHLFDSPNRFGLPAFYTLHVWAWKDNPNGAFVNWHPQVSCSTYVGATSGAASSGAAYQNAAKKK